MEAARPLEVDGFESIDSRAGAAVFGRSVEEVEQPGATCGPFVRQQRFAGGLEKLDREQRAVVTAPGLTRFVPN